MIVVCAMTLIKLLCTDEQFLYIVSVTWRTVL